jgi:hypothetical protein
LGRWLVGINGAAFAATLAASDLSGIGKLGVEDVRFWLTIVGICLAILCLAISLNASLGVGGGETIVEEMTTEDIQYAHTFEILLGYKSGRDAVERRYLLTHILNNLDDPSRPDILVTKPLSGNYLQYQVMAELSDLNWQLRDVAALLESKRVRLRFERAKRLIYIGICGSVMGCLLAIWATNG